LAHVEPDEIRTGQNRSLSSDFSTCRTTNPYRGAESRKGLLLDIHEIEPPLREQVWQAVEQAARDASNEPPGASPLWPQDWIDHVADLAREMKAQRLDPDRPGAWP
jgi:hypothetical protein